MSHVLDLLNAPWAIRPDTLREIHAIYQAHAAGGETKWLKAYREAGDPSPRAGGYSIRDRVALISIAGPIARKMNFFMALFGGVSSEGIGRSLQAALADPGADSILLAISSPGGEVYGIETLANSVRAAHQSKPIVAWTDSMMLSAAYWIGSAAGRVYIGSSTAEAGSIGVVAAHRDISGAEEKAGIKTTQIYAGKYKALASPYQPLSAEDRASIQKKVDYACTQFVDSVARMRGVTVETVLSDMADGRTFMGQQAVDAGLVDGIATLDEVVESVQVEAKSRRTRQLLRSRTMTEKQLKAEHEEVYESLRAEGFARGVLQVRSEYLARILRST